MSGPPAPSGPSAITGPHGLPGEWQLVFLDDFDGPGIDPARWQTDRWDDGSDAPPFNPEDEGAFYSARNVSVSDSCALLTVRPEPAVVHRRSYTHSSGMLSTAGRFAVRDGDLLEARVWVPRGAGLWPAFWTVPDDRWPPETDVFEYFDTSRQSRPMFNHHPQSGGQTGPSPYGPADVDHRDSWHVYGVLRSGGLLLPRLDGVADPAAAVPNDPTDPPMSVLFDLAVYRGSRPPPGAQLRIDWVRVWRPVVCARPGGAAR